MIRYQQRLPEKTLPIPMRKRRIDLFSCQMKQCYKSLAVGKNTIH